MPIFDKASTADALKKLPDVPAETAGVGVSATSDGDVGIRGEVNKDIGQPGGWFLLGAGEYMRKAGGSVAGWLGWKGSAPTRRSDERE